jgi:hypothetical protein
VEYVLLLPPLTVRPPVAGRVGMLLLAALLGAADGLLLTPPPLLDPLPVPPLELC